MPRALALLAVSAMHGLLIVLIARWDHAPAERTIVTSVWLDLRSVPRPPKPAASEPTTETPTDTSRPAARAAPRAPSTAITPERSIMPDWHASGTLAASAAAGRAIEEAGRRALGPRESAKPEPQAPSIFEKPKHVLGETGDDALGYKVVWLSYRCYAALEEPMSMVGRIPMLLHATMCLYPVGKKPARGDLFEGMDSNEESER
jgi:hypothetical protein